MYNFGSPRVGNRRFAEVYNAVILRPFSNFDLETEYLINYNQIIIFFWT
jgi:hypothetical protein